MKLPYVEQFHQNRQKASNKKSSEQEPVGAAGQGQKDSSGKVQPQNNQTEKSNGGPGSGQVNNQMKGQPAAANAVAAHGNNQANRSGNNQQVAAGAESQVAAGNPGMQIVVGAAHVNPSANQPGNSGQQQSRQRQSSGQGGEAGAQLVNARASGKQGKVNDSADSLIGPNNGVQGMQAPEQSNPDPKDIRFQSGLKIKSSVNGNGSNPKMNSSRLAGVKSSRSSARNREVRDPKASGF